MGNRLVFEPFTRDTRERWSSTVNAAQSFSDRCGQAEQKTRSNSKDKKPERCDYKNHLNCVSIQKMKMDHNGLYIALNKTLIAFLVGNLVCAVVIYNYVSKRGVIRADNVPYDPDFVSGQNNEKDVYKGHSHRTGKEWI